MDKIGRGIIAGFLATFALSAVLDPMATLARTAGVLSPVMGWMLHFMVGTLLWGAGFALVHDRMRGPSWLRGIFFGVGAWLAVVIVAVVMAQFRLFRFDLTVTTPAAMLGIHMVFGALLGFVYDQLGAADDARNSGDSRSGRREHLDANDNLHPFPR
jgi:hypothetical protein